MTLVKREEYKMLTVAYIGFGNSVIRYHLPFVKDRAHIKVKSVYRRQVDRDLPGEMEREACYPNIHFTSNLNEILKDPEINLVCVNTLNDTHVMYAKLILNAGKHALIEKPFAMTVEEAKEVFDLAREKGLVVTANQNRRFDADLLTLKKVIDSKVLGELVEIQSHYHYFNPTPRKGRGMLYGLAVHTIDQMVSLFGKADRIVYDVRGYGDPENDDYIDIDFFYGRLKFTIKCSLFAKIDYPKFIAHGTKGSFIKNTQGHLSKHRMPEPLTVSFEPETEANWGNISYINENGEDISTKIQTEVTDYGLVYDNLDQVINNKADICIKEEEILEVLRILTDATNSITGA